MTFAIKDGIPKVHNQIQIGSQSIPRVEMQSSEYIILCGRVESPYTTGVFLKYYKT